MTLRDNFVEALIGFAVLLLGAWFTWYAYTRTQSGSVDGYELIAGFSSAEGIAIGSDVRISGIKVGSVTQSQIDPKTFQARIKLSVAKEIELPVDTVAKITSEGLLGGNYVSLSPGGEMDVLKAGDEIEQTQGSVNLMGIIGQAIYSVGNKPTDKAEAAPAADGVEP